MTPSSTSPLSAVPVQFLVHVVGAPACSTSPEVVGLPLEQSCTALQVGQVFASELIAVNHCGASVTIVDIATLSVPGMIQGNVIQLNSTTYHRTLSWTTTLAHLGFQVMCAKAIDR
jgi:hypothetical protein